MALDKTFGQGFRCALLPVIIRVSVHTKLATLEARAPMWQTRPYPGPGTPGQPSETDDPAAPP